MFWRGFAFFYSDFSVWVLFSRKQQNLGACLFLPKTTKLCFGVVLRFCCFFFTQTNWGVLAWFCGFFFSENNKIWVFWRGFAFFCSDLSVLVVFVTEKNKITIFWGHWSSSTQSRPTPPAHRPTRPNPDPIPTQSRPNPDPIPTQSRPNPDPIPTHFLKELHFFASAAFFWKKNVLFGFFRENDFLGPFLVFFASAAVFLEKKCPFLFFFFYRNDFLGPFLVFFASAAFFWKRYPFLFFFLRKMIFWDFFGHFGFFFQKNDFWGPFFSPKKTLGASCFASFCFCSEKKNVWQLVCGSFFAKNHMLVFCASFGGKTLV